MNAELTRAVLVVRVALADYHNWLEGENEPELTADEAVAVSEEAIEAFEMLVQQLGIANNGEGV